MKMLHLILMTCFCFVSTQAWAESISYFDVDIEMHENGSLTVHEKIYYDFGLDFFGANDRHGITRTIPFMVKADQSRWDIGLKVHSVRMDGKNIPWVVSKELSPTPGINIKVGDPDKTISGKHLFDMVYDVVHGVLPHTDKENDLRWNVTGHAWKVTIENASVTVRLPDSLYEGVVSSNTYSGSPGSSSTQADTFWPDRHTFRATTTALIPGDGLTISLAYPDKLLSNPARKISMAKQPDWIRTHWHWLSLPAACAFMLLYWFVYGRDPSSRQIEPRYQPPEHIDAAHAGLILQGVVGTDVVQIAVLELLRDGYIKVHKEQSGTTTNIITTRLKAADEFLSPHKQLLMQDLFRAGDVLNPEQLSKASSCTLQGVIQRLYAWSDEHGYMKQNPEKTMQKFRRTGYLLALFPIVAAVVDSTFRYDGIAVIVAPLLVGIMMWGVLIAVIVTAEKLTKMMILGVGAVFTLFGWFLFFPGNYHLNTAELFLNVPVWSQVLLLPAIFFASRFMSVRTRKGIKLYAQLAGLKEFMQRVNEDEMKTRLDEDPDYMHKLLPYAVAFGVLDHWLEIFAVHKSKIPVSPSSFDMGDPEYMGWAAGIGGTTTSTSSADSDSSESGSFSGGGAGGGGGESW